MPKGSPGCRKCDHGIQSNIDAYRDIRCKLGALEKGGGKIKMPLKECMLEFCTKFRIEKNVEKIDYDLSYIRVKRAV